MSSDVESHNNARTPAVVGVTRLVKLATALMAGKKPMPKRVALRDRQFEYVGDDEVDYEFE